MYKPIICNVIVQEPWNQDNESVEDSGRSLIYELPVDDKFFIRLQSHDSDFKHEQYMELKGKTIRITIETLEEPS